MSTPLDPLFLAIKKLTRGGPRSLKKEIFDLKDWLGSARSERPMGYMSRPKARAAYLAYHLPLHLPEINWILSQKTFVKNAFLKKPKLRIADLGSGPGTASLSLLSWALAEKISVEKWSFDLFDVSKAALENAKELIHTVAKCEVRTQRKDLRLDLKNLSQEPYDFINLSYLLNEWGNGPRYINRKRAFIEAAMSHLNEKGFLLIVEPPLREPTMDLMSLRDIFANESKEIIQILQPCPGNLLLCPMKQAKLGWCYAQPKRDWARERGLAPWDREIERVLDRTLDRPGFSYLLLQKKAQTGNAEATLHSIAISDERHRDGIRCTPRGIKKGLAPHRGAYIE